MEKKLKIYELNIDPNRELDGIDFISLVQRPAVEYDFLKFSEQTKEKQNYSATNEERVALGVIMLADVPIYRNDKEIGEHYVVFTKEMTKNILLKYFKDERIASVNLDHNPNKIVADKGVFLFQAYIVNRSLGINPPTAFKDVTDGSIIGAFKIEDEAIWEEVKLGTYKGFSIEGMFEYGKVVGQKFEKEPKEDDEMVEYMVKIFNELKLIKK